MVELGVVGHQNDLLAVGGDHALDLRLKIGGVGETPLDGDAGGGHDRRFDRQVPDGVEAGDPDKRAQRLVVDAAQRDQIDLLEAARFVDGDQTVGDDGQAALCAQVPDDVEGGGAGIDEDGRAIWDHGGGQFPDQALIGNPHLKPAGH